LRSTISAIHGNGWSAFSNNGSRPICYTLAHQLGDLLAELARPQVRVLELDGVDEVDAEVAVHRRARIADG
jgi:hypothetical protein